MTGPASATVLARSVGSACPADHTGDSVETPSAGDKASVVMNAPGPSLHSEGYERAGGSRNPFVAPTSGGASDAQGVARTPEAILRNEWADPSSGIRMAAVRVRGSVRRFFQERMSLLVVSPHNTKSIPIDGDSFAYAAAVCQRFAAWAPTWGRTVEFITDPSQAKDDGRLYICVLPVADSSTGFAAQDLEKLAALKAKGIKASLYVGDTVFDNAARMRELFEQVIVLDHHKWGKALEQQVATNKDKRLLLVDTHLLLPDGPADAYDAGILARHLLQWTSAGVTEPSLVARLSVTADKNPDDFPTLRSQDTDADTAEAADLINYFGTYLADWKGGDEQAKRFAILQVVHAIADASRPGELKDQLQALAEGFFGPDFAAQRKAAVAEVAASEAQFLTSDDLISFYRMRSDKPVTLCVHKMAFADLSQREQFDDRVLVHYQVAPDGELDVLMACDPERSGVDVAQVAVTAPAGVPAWGRGHKERAGFCTRLSDPIERAKLAAWWGPAKNPRKILDYVAEQIRAQIASKPAV